MFGCRTTNTSSVLKGLVLLAFLSLFTTKSYAQLGGPPAIVVQPLGLAVQNGGTAVITTTATSLTSMSFTWYYNGKKVNGSNKNTTIANVVVPLVGTVSTVTLSSMSTNSSGTYYVAIKNSAGTVVSSNAAVLVVTSVVSNVVSFVSSATGMTKSGFKIQLSAPTGSNVVIHASSDLTHWTPISTNTATSGSVAFTDTNALNVTCRFYRAYIQ